MSTQTIPLFPLNTVLLPYGRMPLQIFEPRYLDMVSSCLKSDTGFGVVWLRQGSEVLTTAPPHSGTTETLSSIGTYAKIVDWDSLPNGLLGITIEGENKFRLLSSEKKANHQHVANVEWIEKEPVIPLPDEAQELQALVKQLLSHPHVAKLRINDHIHDVSHLACVLTQLLPVDEEIKFNLLAIADPLERFEQLVALLNQLTQQMC